MKLRSIAILVLILQSVQLAAFAKAPAAVTPGERAADALLNTDFGVYWSMAENHQAERISDMAHNRRPCPGGECYLILVDADELTQRESWVANVCYSDNCGAQLSEAFGPAPPNDQVTVGSGGGACMKGTARVIKAAFGTSMRVTIWNKGRPQPLKLAIFRTSPASPGTQNQIILSRFSPDGAPISAEV